MNIWFGDEIYNLQAHGGISVIWNNIIPLLKAELAGFTWDVDKPCEIYLPSYYSAKPEGSKSVVLCYDWIANRYPGIPKHTPDIQWKHAAIQSADAVIAISQWTADDVKKFTGRDASVAYPATTLERASHEDVQAFRAKYGIDSSYVLVVGRRDLYKNVSTYFQALRLLQGQPPLTFCVGGENVPDAYMQGLPVGYRQLPAADLAAAYTGALCLVYPSLYEGFGLPVLEAYACGCPVICGNGGALAEINEAALVVDVTKPREIAQALVKMSDPGVRIDHILRGYDVVKRFGWKQMAERVAAVIRTVAEKEPVA
jgi:glycosyltransferase involved in cell wall biosynthesis